MSSRLMRLPRLPRRSLFAAVALGMLGTTLGLVAFADPPKGGFAPDPPARASNKHWTIELTAKDGKVTAHHAKAITLAQAAETPRVIGRFAVELYIGFELLDRARFNVPLMGDDPPSGNRNKLPRPRFDQGVSARVNVRIADNPRASYLLVVDRDSGTIQKLLWPPEPDGRLIPWTSGVSDAKPGDFPDGGVRAAGHRDGGVSDASAPIDAGPVDAARD